MERNYSDKFTGPGRKKRQVNVIVLEVWVSSSVLEDDKDQHDNK